MKRLDRYILRELFVPFLIGTVAVVLMFLGNQLIFQFKTYQMKSVPVAATLQALLFKTPQYLSMTLPVGMALASSLAIARLARESELTAMRSAGASLRRVLAPVAVFGVLVSIGNFYLVERIMPPSEKAFRQVANKVGLLGALPDFKTNVVINLKNYTVNFGNVSRISEDRIAIQNIIMFERPRQSETWIYTADRGEYRDGIWHLEDVTLWAFNGPELTVAKPKESMTINEKVTVQDLFAPPEAQEQTAAELMSAIREGKKAGRDTTWLQVSYHAKFSVPAACLVFALVGPVFAVYFARTGGFVGVLLSIIMVLIYYNAYVISTEILGRNGVVAPILAAWLPNLVFIVFGLIGMRRLE